MVTTLPKLPLGLGCVNLRVTSNLLTLLTFTKISPKKHCGEKNENQEIGTRHCEMKLNKEHEIQEAILLA